MFGSIIQKVVSKDGLEITTVVWFAMASKKLESRRASSYGLLGELGNLVQRLAVSLAVSAEHAVFVSSNHFALSGQLHGLIQCFAFDAGCRDGCNDIINSL
jgi:hypothetical protein